METDNIQELAVAIERELKDQGCLYGVEREVVQRANLISALEEIRPTRHTEFAFAVWAGSQCEVTHHIIYEYCRRRSGFPSSLFDHPLLALEMWCMPDTCRLLVFREQLDTLGKQLTGNSVGRRVARGVYRFGGPSAGISPEKFRGMIDPQNGLSEGEITQFYDYINERYGESLPYAWCSTIAERALIRVGGGCCGSTKDVA